MGTALITNGDYGRPQASLSIHAAAVGHVLELTRESGIDSAFPQLLKTYLDRAVAAAHGSLELAALFEEVKNRRGGV